MWSVWEKKSEKIDFAWLQGMHVSLTQQIQQVTDTSEQLALSLGEEAAADLFRRSVFYVSIGSNDFIHYYLRNTSSVQSLYLPWEFNQLLVNTVKQELKVSFNPSQLDYRFSLSYLKFTNPTT